MKISARNVFKGKVTKISEGVVNCEVTIKLPGGDEITSIITKGSLKKLGLKKGKIAYAIIKSSSVLVAID